MTVSRTTFRRLTVAALAFTLLVIVWGAFVRATGSGAGCGSHWPMCNGEIVPRAPALATIIELTHRVTSGIALILVLVQAVFAFFALPAGHFGRKTSIASLVFMITEALIGAGLVLFEKVAHDASIARGYWMSAHLINTFLLIGAMGLTVWSASHDERPTFVGNGRAATLLVPGLFGLLIVGVTGAIAALGDTLFPARTLAEGLAQDVASGAHVFVQLRVLHPFIAAAAALHLLIVAATFARFDDAATRRFATWLGLSIVLQVALGVINLVLSAPIALQLAHLLAADLVWLTLIALTASALSSGQRVETPVPARAVARPLARG